ncbi:MAG: hypothetical protein ACRDJP_06915 [Actinomycetota bacterium]
MPEASPATLTGRTLLPLLVAMMLATACGSTVPKSAQVGGQPVAGVEEGGLGIPTEVAGQEAGVGGGGGTGAGGGTSGTGTTGGTGSGGTDGGGGGGKGGKGGGGGAALGPGITDKKIYVAMSYADAGSANQAAFGTPLDVDARKPYNAMIKEVNAAGGILGRDIEPIYYEFSAATTARPIDQQAQAACAHWTQDHEVFFMLASDASGILQECAHKAGAVHPMAIGSALPEEFTKFPHYVEMAGLNFIRSGDVTITGLANGGYFEGTPRIGIILWDHPAYRDALDRGYLPALRGKGFDLATEPAYITPPQQFNDLAATSADVNSAVLRFQTQGITHVMILAGPAGLCSGACLESLVLNRSKSQGYYPRYGFNANNLPVAGQQAGLYPNDQLRRSVAVEWSALDEGTDEGWKTNQARESCYALMRKHGVPLENANQKGYASFACDQFRFIQLVIGKMDGAPLNADNFMVGVNKVGGSFASINAFATNITAKQHDGVAAARNMSFQDGCECYKWTTQPYPV